MNAAELWLVGEKETQNTTMAALSQSMRDLKAAHAKTYQHFAETVSSLLTAGDQRAAAQRKVTRLLSALHRSRNLPPAHALAA